MSDETAGGLMGCPIPFAVRVEAGILALRFMVNQVLIQRSLPPVHGGYGPAPLAVKNALKKPSRNLGFGVTYA
jgi:hypothetical protein